MYMYVQVYMLVLGLYVSAMNHVLSRIHAITLYNDEVPVRELTYRYLRVRICQHLV
jgi:hypothetical protein